MKETEFIFEWDLKKELENIRKHHISFNKAIEVFKDPNAIYLEDDKHSKIENRFYAVGKISSEQIITVRYTLRRNVIRVFGAAHWRKWRKFYEQNS
ncbi:MAG: BrnT family toxin [Deltaproteobacteria bacterium]|nr:BrnT family toxin [Deltaproteobacteria bacterium]